MDISKYFLNLVPWDLTANKREWEGEIEREREIERIWESG